MVEAGLNGVAGMGRKMLGVVVAGLMVVSIGVAQTVKTPAPKAVLKVTAEAAPKTGDTNIKVHGHWSIVVKNADGSVASRHEFENALVTPGAQILAKLLTGTAVPSDYFLTLTSTGTSPCGTTSDNQGAITQNACLVGEGHTAALAYCGAANSFCSFNLVKANTGPGVSFQGSFTAPATGTLNAVASSAALCIGSGTSPSACANQGTSVFDFTATTITPVSIVTGQIVQVTLTISFS